MINRANKCPNLNHNRTNVPVRLCPACGEVVNADIPIKTCSEEKHAQDRRNHNKYCMDCGEQLIQG